jgi:hypothetical protein
MAAVGREERAFSASSPWNAPIPASPTLDANSAAMAGYLGSEMKANADLYEYGSPVWTAGEGDPFNRVLCTESWGTCQLSEQQIPIPANAEGARGSDGSMIVIDPSTGRGYDFWRAHRTSPTSWSTAWGTRFSLTGTGTGGGATGAGVPLLAGLPRLFEMTQGHVDHALGFITTNTCANVYRYPASKTDGHSTSSNCIPEGARIQLDPSINVDAIPGITPGEKIVAHALQTYGAYCKDSGGSRLAFGFEDPLGKSNPYPSLGFSGDYYPMPHIPWNHLRVLSGANPPNLPSVTAVSPSSGSSAGGTSVHVTGTGFNEVTSVLFGSQEAAGVTVSSATSITAVAPPGFGTVNVTVETPSGASIIGPADRFHYLAEPLELGRCLRTPQIGAYDNGACTAESQDHSGNYEWFSGVGSAPNFSGTFRAVTLETAGKVQITCNGGSNEGRYAGGRKASFVGVLSGCESRALHKSCQSEASPTGQIKLATSSLELAIVAGGEEPRVGATITGANSKQRLASFKCGLSSEPGARSLVLQGTITMRLNPVNRMVSRLHLRPQSSRAGMRNTPSKPTVKLVSPTSETVEEGTLRAIATLQATEPLEIKAAP